MAQITGVYTIILLFILIQTIACDKNHKNKYSKESNADIFKSETYDPEIRDLKNPYRIGKLNLVWEKAKHRLTEPKLKSLYTELKIHDKEEIAWKQLNSQHKDKDGVKAGELRHKLVGIMSTYDLLDHFEDTQDPVKTKPYKRFHDKNDNNYLTKSLFKDKKLNRLWEKAEISGFSQDELKTLKEEFEHHQDKIDLYYNLLEEIGNQKSKKEYHENAVNEDELETFNEITNLDKNEIPGADKHNDYSNDVNKLRDSHREIKDHYERLERLTARGPNSQEFIEPKVEGLWRVAQASNFTTNELDSIKQELRHFESRLMKLRHLHADYALTKEKHKKEKTKDKHDKFQEMNDHIKKQTRKVEKLQDDLEKIIFKHSEL